MEYWEGNGKKMPAVVTNEFRGLNRLAKGKEGEFSDCLNVSADEYPCLCVSKGFETVQTEHGRVMAIYSLDGGFTGVCETDDGVFVFYKGTRYEYSVGGKRIGSESDVYMYCLGGTFFIHETTKLGNSVLYKLMPEADDEADRTVKQCYILNTEFEAMLYDNGDALSANSLKYAGVSILAIKDMPEDFTLGTFSEYSTIAENIADAKKYIVFGPEGEEDKFMVYRENEWEYDKWLEENNKTTVPRYMMGVHDSIVTDEEFTVPFPGGEKTFQYGHAYNSLKGVAFSDKKGINTMSSLLDDGDKSWHEVAVIATNVMPKVTSMEVYKGRLWCARRDGTSILASALNDNGEDFFYFSGTAAASVYIDSNLPGAFIGVKAYNDSLIAFKEDSMTVIYGDTAANFSVGKEIVGVGCIDIRSAQVVDGVLYFCSPSGFYAYAGGQPQRISEKLKARYKKVSAFVADGKYYAEGTRADGTCELLVYDTEKGIWMAEESRGVSGFCAEGGEVYIAAGGGVLRKKRTDEEAEACDWYFESMEICEGVFERKGISEIYIKAKLAQNTQMTVKVMVGGEELESKTFSGNGKIRTYRAPVRMRKDDSYKIRVSGTGDAIIYEMERRVTVGGRNIGKAEK